MRGVPSPFDSCMVEGCDSRPRGLNLCEKHYRRFKRTGSTDRTTAEYETEVDRFWHHVRRGEGCWIWTSETVKGYGRFKRGDRSRIMAHRYSYELEHGSIPEGLTIDHLCRTTLCVRPDHLEPVTMQENIRRGLAARRQ
jgi:hypothetical protein